MTPDSANKVRVSDYIAQLLVDAGVEDVFMLTGGGSMHLNDAFGLAPGLRPIFLHHEQGCAIAAESYARLSGKLPALNVTTGPGGVNALNGVYGAYVDSIGMVVVSGQVKRETFAPFVDPRLRQLGDQEVDIVSMVKPITKYATVLREPEDTRRVVEKALWLARRGRPGPVWIDVPGDVQGAMIDPAAQAPFDPAAEDREGEAPNTAAEEGLLEGAALDAEVAALMAEIRAAERPVVLAGAGVRLSGQHVEFLRFVEGLGAPVVTGWNAHDAIHNDHPLYVGRPGSLGDRGGNFAVQTADYVLVLGSRLNIRQVSFNWQSFARDARVAMVDVDAAELAKPTLSLHRPIHADLRAFFTAAEGLPLPADDRADARAAYLAWSSERAARYPVVLPEYWERDGFINPYCFGAALFAELEEGDVVVTGDGTACVTIFQAADLKRGQRLWTNSGCASMGYDLPAAIGAWYAGDKEGAVKRIVCLAGDGSIMMNLQELQTIVGAHLPIKLFVLNNDGYHSIRQAQQNYFPTNIVGCGPDSGVTFPDYQRLAEGFGLPAARVDSHADLPAAIRAMLDAPGAQLLEVVLDKEQAFAPKLSSRRLEDGTMVSSPLEDMAPFLPRDELAAAMAPSAPASVPA
jgi:acetolactate synthase-1/2/3 large subunit